MIKFDSINSGDVFIYTDKYNKCIKLDINSLWGLYSIDKYGNKTSINAVSIRGDLIHVKWDEMVSLYDEKNSTLDLQKENDDLIKENMLFLRFVDRVSHEYGCKCDEEYVCPVCFVLKYKKEVDSQEKSVNVDESELNNKQIEIKQMKTLTLKEAVIESIDQIKNSSNTATVVVSAHQVTNHIRGNVNDKVWEIPECSNPNSNFPFWIEHNSVRDILGNMYSSNELSNFGFMDRKFNGTFYEYNFDTNVVSVPTTVITPSSNVVSPGVSIATNSDVGPVSKPTDVSSKVTNFLADATGTITLKRVQSALKVKGVTCKDLVAIVSNCGKRLIPDSTNSAFSKFNVVD